LLREGLPIQIAKLHAQTFSQIEYHIKHKLGIGSKSHSNNHPTPIFGVGQGSTDASAQWSFLSDALIRAYNDNANDAIITSPISKISSNNKIYSFVDDTTTLLIKHYTMVAFLLLLLRHDAQL
jgi:4-hydroxy-L-threonine phosphate dehydrogenase PdxA